MTQIRTIAPTVVDFLVVPGAALRDPDAYRRFWRDQQVLIDRHVSAWVPDAVRGDTTAAAPSIVLEHAARSEGASLYRTIAADSLLRSTHVVSATLDPVHLPASIRGADVELGGQVREVCLRLYDHGVLLVEVLTDLDPWLDARDADLARAVLDLEERIVDLTERVARECVTQYLAPVLDSLRKADTTGALVARAGQDQEVGRRFGDVLWVARALIVDPDRAATWELVEHWVKDVGRVEGEVVAPIEQLVNGDLDSLTRWLNYVYVDREHHGASMQPGAMHADRWNGLRHAQFFYSAMDLIDGRLSTILADAAVVTSRWELDDLRAQLVSLSQRAEFIIMQLHDVSKYLKREVRYEFDMILGHWEYERLVEQPVRFKIQTCDRRLAELATKRAVRSAMYTDLILLGIAVTAVLGTALALAEFGRLGRSDPGLAGYDISGSAITDWFAAQPADAILLISGVLSLLVVLLYLYIRRSHQA
jgi:hypothetical protein